MEVYEPFDTISTALVADYYSEDGYDDASDDDSEDDSDDDDSEDEEAEEKLKNKIKKMKGQDQKRDGTSCDTKS